MITSGPEHTPRPRLNCHGPGHGFDLTLTLPSFPSASILGRRSVGAADKVTLFSVYACSAGLKDKERDAGQAAPIVSL